MSANANKVFLLGRLTKDPEMKYLPSGSALTKMSMATNRSFKNQAGEKCEETTFANVTVWGKTAENCAEYLKKGSQIFLEGRLQSRTWDDAETGKKRYALDVVAENIQFLGSKSGAKVDEEAQEDQAVGTQPKEDVSDDVPF